MKYQFRATWIPSLVTVMLLPLLVGLGFWQLDRAEQKRALQAEYDRRSSAPPLALDASTNDAQALRFRKVSARGEYEPAYQILLDNRVHNGRVGYYVITPLRLQGSDTRVLVNRGWIPLGGTRTVLPDAPSPLGMQEVVGIATVPAARFFRLGAEPPRGEWQPVWQYMDMKRYTETVRVPLLPVLVLLDPASEAGGFVRQWGRLDAGIATHQGYAFQWFALAIALATVYLFVNIHKTGKTPS